MPAVLAQEPFDFIPLIGSQRGRQADRIDEQNELNRRIGVGRNPIERVKGENLVRLPVVEQSKIAGPKSGYGLSRLIRYHNVQLDQSLLRAERVAGRCILRKSRPVLARLRKSKGRHRKE
jgi:hypothetical protein